MELNERETIIRQSRATHWKHFEGVGGKLFLTNQRLIFKSHPFNIQTHEEAIALEDILAIEAKHNDFISAKMLISLRNGSKEKYYVPHRKIWVKEIEKAIEKVEAKMKW